MLSLTSLDPGCDDDDSSAGRDRDCEAMKEAPGSSECVKVAYSKSTSMRRERGPRAGMGCWFVRDEGGTVHPNEMPPLRSKEWSGLVGCEVVGKAAWVGASMKRVVSEGSDWVDDDFFHGVGR